MGGTGQLLVGPGHVTSGLISIRKRQIKTVLWQTSANHNKTARKAPLYKTARFLNIVQVLEHVFGPEIGRIKLVVLWF